MGWQVGQGAVGAGVSVPARGGKRWLVGRVAVGAGEARRNGGVLCWTGMSGRLGWVRFVGRPTPGRDLVVTCRVQDFMDLTVPGGVCYVNRLGEDDPDQSTDT